MKMIRKTSLIFALCGVVCSNVTSMPSAGGAIKKTATPIASTAAATTNIVATAVASPATKKAQSEQIIEAIKKDMAEVNTIKDELKSKLAELDTKLHDARQATVEAKKSSFQILRQENQRAARDTFDKVKEKLTTIKSTQSFVQGAFTQDFNQRIAKFNTHIAKLQSKVQTLAAIKPPSRKVSDKKSIAKKQKQRRAAAAEEDLSLTGKIMQHVTDLLARIFQWVKQGRDWLLKSSAAPESTNSSGQKKKSLAKASVTKKAGGMPGAAPGKKPAGMPGVASNATPASSGTITSAQIQAQLTIFDATVKQMDTSRLMLSSRYQDVKKVKRAVYKQLRGYQEFDGHYTSYGYANSVEVTKWKKVVVAMFSTVVDTIALGITKTIELCIKTYRFFIKPTIKKISDDVQKKLDHLEETQETK